MTKRYDVAAPREYTDRGGDKKTSWTNLGVAFEKDGRISILLNALPMPGPDGQAKLVLMEPKQDSGNRDFASARGEQRRPGAGEAQASRRVTDDLDDDVPF